MSQLHPESLRPFNTFGLECQARRYVPFEEADALRRWLAEADGPVFILGGGSNLLLPGKLEATVLHNRIPGKKVIRTEREEVMVRAGGGERWHDLVTWAVDQGLGGIENLALIPGTVGAAPIQNIGAYGVELTQVFHQLEAMDRSNGQIRRFDREECRFGYRDSIFKQEEKDRWVILNVTLRLSRRPQLQLDYGDIRKELAAAGIGSPEIRDVCEAVIRIRQSKLPDPAHIGNAGSFFKNPVVPSVLLDNLRDAWGDIPHYPAGEGQVKLPAAWLIEKAGWKGTRRERCGVHEKQALVLVNYGGATQQEILALARDIRQDVRQKFGVLLVPEVNVIGGKGEALDPDSAS